MVGLKTGRVQALWKSAGCDRANVLHAGGSGFNPGHLQVGLGRLPAWNPEKLLPCSAKLKKTDGLCTRQFSIFLHTPHAPSGKKRILRVLWKESFSAQSTSASQRAHCWARWANGLKSTQSKFVKYSTRISIPWNLLCLLVPPPAPKMEEQGDNPSFSKTK